MKDAKSVPTKTSYKYPSYKKYPSEGICKVKEDEGPLEPKTILQLFVVIFALIVISIAVIYFCRNWSRRTDNNNG